VKLPLLMPLAGETVSHATLLLTDQETLDETATLNVPAISGTL